MFNIPAIAVYTPKPLPTAVADQRRRQLPRLGPSCSTGQRRQRVPARADLAREHRAGPSATPCSSPADGHARPERQRDHHQENPAARCRSPDQQWPRGQQPVATAARINREVGFIGQEGRPSSLPLFRETTRETDERCGSVFFRAAAQPGRGLNVLSPERAGPRLPATAARRARRVGRRRRRVAGREHAGLLGHLPAAALGAGDSVRSTHGFDELLEPMFALGTLIFVNRHSELRRPRQRRLQSIEQYRFAAPRPQAGPVRPPGRGRLSADSAARPRASLRSKRIRSLAGPTDPTTDQGQRTADNGQPPVPPAHPPTGTPRVLSIRTDVLFLKCIPIALASAANPPGRRSGSKLIAHSSRLYAALVAATTAGLSPRFPSLNQCPPLRAQRFFSNKTTASRGLALKPCRGLSCLKISRHPRNQSTLIQASPYRHSLDIGASTFGIVFVLWSVDFVRVGSYPFSCALAIVHRGVGMSFVLRYSSLFRHSKLRHSQCFDVRVLSLFVPSGVFVGVRPGS